MADWSIREDQIIITDYFDMLSSELRGLPFSKTKHRELLLKSLRSRSESAIEKKHQNISAVLIKYGMPYIKGYKPLPNYQQLLEEEVLSILAGQNGMEKAFVSFAEKETTQLQQTKTEFGNWIVEPPLPAQPGKYKARSFKPVKRNYLEIEQNNRSIGLLGEQFVFDYEIWRLHNEERPQLAKQVEWISKEKGDGAGYDILSKSADGKDMYIEVKTTQLGKESPIFFSDSELQFSSDNRNQFYLYRVFDVRENPRLFIKSGQLDEICSYTTAVKIKGYF